MSKGLGHIQRKIDQLFATDPEGVFSTEDLCLPGGHWWRHVQEWIAERDGDTAKMEEFRALREAAEQETLAKLESVLRTNKH